MIGNELLIPIWFVLNWSGSSLQNWSGVRWFAFISRRFSIRNFLIRYEGNNAFQRFWKSTMKMTMTQFLMIIEGEGKRVPFATTRWSQSFQRCLSAYLVLHVKLWIFRRAANCFPSFLSIFIHLYSENCDCIVWNRVLKWLFEMRTTYMSSSSCTPLSQPRYGLGPVSQLWIPLNFVTIFLYNSNETG
jgi:hypothetical protein